MADSFSTSSIWPNYATSNVQKAASTKTQTLGKDQFLSILLTQMQNQDPMQPMEDKEFIAQLAQFSSVEQLLNISNQLTAMSQSLGNVSSLIGKQISWLDEGSSTEEGGEGSTPAIKSGIVDSIIVKDGVQYASVGDIAIPITKIIEIMDAKKDETAPPEDQTPPADQTPPVDDGTQTADELAAPGEDSERAGNGDSE